MSRMCELSGVGPFSGNNVSHSNIKTRRRWLPNLKKKRYTIPELGQVVTLTLSARSIRTIDRQGGIVAAVLKAKEEKLSPTLQRIRRAVKKQRSTNAAPKKASA